MKFVDSKINENILKALDEMGFVEMTPIQEEGITPLQEGRDIIGQAQTGTGKTAAFGIPLIENIDMDSEGVQGIVICPTRELALQVTEELRKYAKHMKGIKVTPVFGGQDMQKQIRDIKGAKIVVGTPGRIMDHMRRKTIKLRTIKMVVLDEADEMLNMGFKEDIEHILTDVPEERQTALFSATMPPAILKITKKFQKNAIHVKTEKIQPSEALIDQQYFEIKGAEKQDLLCRLMDFHDAKRTIIFCKTKRGADALAGSLKAKGYPAEPLHGDLSQGQRNTAMAQFRNGKAHIMIATDVAARGIDVDDVELVINYDIPMEEEYYVHRIGRTGRAGRKGVAITFVVGKEIYKLRAIEKYSNIRIAPGTPPSVKTVIKAKSNKVFEKAIQTCKKEDLDDMKKLIANKLEEMDISIEDLAAALLRNEMGDSGKEILGNTQHRKERNHREVERHGRRRDSGRRDSGRRDSGRKRDSDKRWESDKKRDGDKKKDAEKSKDSDKRWESDKKKDSEKGSKGKGKSKTSGKSSYAGQGKEGKNKRKEK